MKNIILLSLVSLAFVACGTSTSDEKSVIPLTAPCNAENDTSAYHLLQSGDEISQEETLIENPVAPKVEILHIENGDKKVCLKSGSTPAVIIR